MNLPLSKPSTIKSGYCYLVDMNPGRRSKPGKVRPVVVIQTTDTIERGSPGIVIVPCTTQLREENMLRIRITLHAELDLNKASDLLLDQIHTVDRGLFLKELGPVNLKDWEKITEGIRFLLGF